uniref:T-complex-associated testis-expressed protein 1 n=1 Tax=Branchiostoma floridae TaxID=7739 RepID=C3Z2I9_BRAFL|eukprot:XP_002597228.1 hypothetical protein BRAFLDRAFT_118129 [Branchiostoma floridae]
MAEPPLAQNGSKSGPGSVKSGKSKGGSAKSKSKGKDGVPSPVTTAKDNPSADPRTMRRIIAEDPEWSLATVPLLTDLCIVHIVNNFEHNPLLDELKPKHRAKVLEKISTNIPLKVTAHLISDEGYWQRCCKARWDICDVSHYGGSWKRMYFERNLEHIIEHFVPERTNMDVVTDVLPLSGEYIRRLNIKQLLPPIKEETKKDDDTSETGSELGDGPEVDHFEFGPVFEKLPHLEEFGVTYGVKDCGMNFEWNLFQFTTRDCLLISKAVKSCKTLQKFHLCRSKVDDDKVRVLISHLLDHPSLTELDLSHNMIGDSGARAAGKLINRSRVVKMNLCDNKIGAPGALAIGHAVSKNTTLKCLDLRLNRLGDDGGQAICKALLKNSTLTDLNIGSNNMTEPTASILSQVLTTNTTIRTINLSCNRVGPDGGKQLQEGMEENSTVLEMDLRLTEAGQESEYCINQILKKNREDDRQLRLQNEKNKQSS